MERKKRQKHGLIPACVCTHKCRVSGTVRQTYIRKYNSCSYKEGIKTGEVNCESGLKGKM